MMCEVSYESNGNVTETVFSRKEISCWHWLGCALIRIILEGDILNLLVYWNHINEDYYVMRVERDSYEWIWNIIGLTSHMD